MDTVTAQPNSVSVSRHDLADDIHMGRYFVTTGLDNVARPALI